MAMGSTSLDRMVTALVPSLSKSLGEQFNVFRVMHHGTHEKQLSNVFAWLLRPEATHELGDRFQRLFVEQVNRDLPAEEPLPAVGYRVQQEVDTSAHDDPGKDIADIVLTNADASVVVENFESSDGHGHDYYGYLAYGTAGGTKRSVVVLLCARRESHRQTDGWENAVVVTYADVLKNLKASVATDRTWQRTHPRQHVFLNELIEHFLEGPRAVSNEDQIAFIKTMCETGESARYGYRPQTVAAQEFANLLAQHAQQQFEDGRRMLGETKRLLRDYANRTLTGQVNEASESGHIGAVHARFSGQWEWCVTLERAQPYPNIFLEFGPTAVVENKQVPEPLPNPDYSKLFITRHTPTGDNIDLIIQTDVGLDEVLAGLRHDDTRLRESVLEAVRAN